MLDELVIKAFREVAEAQRIGYRILINRTLRESLLDGSVAAGSIRLAGAGSW
jgi:hypothetical protein